MKHISVLSRLFSAIAVFLFFVISVSFGQTQPVIISPERYQVDAGLKLIICHKTPAFPAGQSLPVIRFDKDYTFTQTVASFEVGQAYKIKNGAAEYTLFFTNLPLIKLSTVGKQAISNTDARTKGNFTLTNGNDPLFSASMGIRIRGNASRLFPKKQYNINLWKDPNGDDDLEKSLLNLREDSKWLLMAMYNEPLRLHNAASQNLWLNLHKLYYIDKEPDANSAIRTNYCDVFINDSYAGIYMLAEDLDRKQLKLKKTGSNGEVKGELYKTAGASEATAFNTLPAPPTNPDAEVWDLFEMDYPDPYWNNLYDLLNYAVKSPANEFRAKLSEKFKVDNLIDYFIFLNLIYATDHWGNNQFVARYKENEPYFLIPWDLDGTFGYTPTGSRSEETRRMNSNGLFDRLLALDPNGFKSKMRKRWFALRQTTLSLQALKTTISGNFNLLTSEGAYAREGMKWPGTVRPDDFPKVNTWIENRVAFLDDYFALFPEEMTGVQLAYFQGETVGNSKKLSWSFHQAEGVQKVEVEHSTNGTSFSYVGQVTGSSPNEPYQFTHANSASRAYYRLKIVTGNGFTHTAFLQIGANSCPGPPVAPSVEASLTEVTSGQSVVLTASGCDHTVVWNTGQTGTVVVIKPTETAGYSAKCRQAAGCESASSASASVSVFAANALPGNYEGYLGQIDCGFIRGWAWDKTEPNTPVSVDILDGQQVIGTTIAGIYRQDLKDANKGNGSHSYIFAVPETVKDNKPHQISVRIHGTSYVLRDSPKRLICEAKVPLSSEAQAPAAPVVAPLSATVNAPFSTILPTFYDPDSPVLTYTLTGLPTGLSFLADTRTLSGMPTTTGTRSLTYAASDGTNTTVMTVSLVVEAQSSSPVTGNFEGYLDKVECGTIRGWVWDRNRPNEPLTVEFFANGQPIGTTDANIFRQDLLTAGKGNGYHVYQFATPNEAKTGQAVSISAKVRNSTYTLKESPKSLTCPRVNQPPLPPVSVDPLLATVSVAFSVTLPVFTDPDSPSLTYTLTGLPGGLGFAADTRTLSGTPTATGTWSLTYGASDGVNTTATTVSLIVEQPATPVTGDFEGFLDKVECGTIRGWVWDRRKPNEPLTVEFFANGLSIGTAKADMFRQDLLAAGKGNGAHVYQFTTPDVVKTGQTFQITANVKNSTYTLKGSPKPLSCAPAARLSVVSAEDESTGAEGLFVTPNPAQGEFEVRFYTETTTESELSVVDELGRSWYSKSLKGTGFQRQKVHLSGAKGSYIVVLRQGTKVRSKRILIRR
ncbi:CotH kinase family protein [Larkinella punicea]|uniref:T9SS C-terminal target domain-containing protein n=1 Tax=Larkinella punicea TaxID=2315727 RepID=A0A368JKG3_9BACT|nr:CotH kinase family protein [Larkinella punicea]RCR68159.1 T9SS C-terminal target domain-containing protein [Larkinella punicea]